MILEVTGRTKKCTDCGVIAHNTVMLTHSCVVSEESEVVPAKKMVKKAVKKVTKKK